MRLSIHPPLVWPRISLLRRTCQQVRDLNAKSARKTLDDIYTGRINTPLQRADVGPVNLSTMCQLLL